jgi:hypothetical protein
MASLALADSRCTHCDCPSERQQLLTAAVVEAARQVMFWHLREERTMAAWQRTVTTLETIDALQTLRDCLASERAGRG